MKSNLPELLRLIVGGMAVSVAMGAHAAGTLTVQHAWARPTVPGQPVAGAYMDITSDRDAVLLELHSDAAQAVQVHAMTDEGGVMRMREVDRPKLQAGKPLRLAPGGMHLMLLDLKHPLRLGDSVGLDVVWSDAAGGRHQDHVAIPVRASAGAEGTR